MFIRTKAPLPVRRDIRYSAESVTPELASVTSRLPPEPEDAHLTGATRSLSRRLLALNLRKAC